MFEYIIFPHDMDKSLYGEHESFSKIQVMGQVSDFEKVNVTNLKMKSNLLGEFEIWNQNFKLKFCSNTNFKLKIQIWIFTTPLFYIYTSPISNQNLKFEYSPLHCFVFK